MPEQQPLAPAGITRPGLVPITAGEWAGWYHYEPVDEFEERSGPFYARQDPAGGGAGIECGFRPGPHNANGAGNVHGGALMTFADYALFMLAGGMDGSVHGVTVTCNSEFVGGAAIGALLTARGEVIRAGGSLIFLRGLIAEGSRPVMAFSGTIKRLRR